MSRIDYEGMECKFCGGDLVPDGDFDVTCVSCGRSYSLA